MIGRSTGPKLGVDGQPNGGFLLDSLAGNLLLFGLLVVRYHLRWCGADPTRTGISELSRQALCPFELRPLTSFGTQHSRPLEKAVKRNQTSPQPRSSFSVENDFLRRPAMNPRIAVSLYFQFAFE